MTRKRDIEEFRVAHVGFRVIDCPNQGVTFQLFAGMEDVPERRTALFSGHVEKGMSSQLHRLAAHISTLEEKI